MIIEKRDMGYISRILEHCKRIREDIDRFGDSFDKFNTDSAYCDSVCLNIFQIGEISNQLSEEIKSKLADVPWSEIYGMRNILAHAYIKVDNKIVWEVIKNDIPVLEEKLQTI